MQRPPAAGDEPSDCAPLPAGHGQTSSLGAELAVMGGDLEDLFERFTRRFDLSLVQSRVLQLVARNAPAALEPWQIAQVLGLGSNHLTMVLDRLVAQGRLDRRAHPDDGRRRLVTATAEGAEVADRLRRGLETIEDRLLAAALSTDEQAEMRRLTARMRHALREMVIPAGRVRPGP